MLMRLMPARSRFYPFNVVVTRVIVQCKAPACKAEKGLYKSSYYLHGGLHLTRYPLLLRRFHAFYLRLVGLHLLWPHMNDINNYLFVCRCNPGFILSFGKVLITETLFHINLVNLFQLITKKIYTVHITNKIIIWKIYKIKYLYFFIFLCIKL